MENITITITIVTIHNLNPKIQNNGINNNNNYINNRFIIIAILIRIIILKVINKSHKYPFYQNKIVNNNIIIIEKMIIK